jgi:hypothetical protein
MGPSNREMHGYFQGGESERTAGRLTWSRNSSVNSGF